MADRFWDCYEVNAIDPVDARNVAVQRLIDETGHGLDIYELADVCESKSKGGLNDGHLRERSSGQAHPGSS